MSRPEQTDPPGAESGEDLRETPHDPLDAFVARGLARRGIAASDGLLGLLAACAPPSAMPLALDGLLAEIAGVLIDAADEVNAGGDPPRGEPDTDR